MPMTSLQGILQPWGPVVTGHRFFSGLSQPKCRALHFVAPWEMLLKFLWICLKVIWGGYEEESGTVLLTPLFHLSDLYADSNDCTNSSQNILAVYTKNCFDRKPPNTAKGSLLVQNKGVHAVFLSRVPKCTVVQGWCLPLEFPEFFAAEVRIGEGCPEERWEQDSFARGKLPGLCLLYYTPSRAVCLFVFSFVEDLCKT